MKRILSILSYVGMALVFAALATRILKPEWDQYAVYASWAGLAMVLLYTVGQWREIVAYFRRRNARYGAIASVSVLVVLGILIAVNYLSVKQNKRWDLTANRQYSLSEQTVKLLKGLEAPVKFVVFEQDTNMERFKPRLSEYQYQSPQVSVYIKEYNSQRVTIDGAVKKPGVYPIKGKATLLQVIAMAESVNPDASDEIVIFCESNGKRTAAKFDLGEIRAGRAEDPAVQARDLIVADSSTVKAVFQNVIKVLPAVGIFATIL